MYEDVKLNSTSTASPTQRELEGLEKSVSVLLDTAHTLNQRLNTVLRPESEEKLSGATPQETLSPLPDTIRNFAQRIKNTTDTLQSILNRLEL